MLVKEGRKALLDFLLGAGGPACVFHLFVNNPAMADEDVTLGDLTEASFGGYAAISGITFPAAVINGADHGETLSPTQTWTATGAPLPQTVYGMYMTMTVSGSDKLIFVKRFSSPQVLSLAGETVNKKFDMLSDDSNVPAFAP